MAGEGHASDLEGEPARSLVSDQFVCSVLLANPNMRNVGSSFSTADVPQQRPGVLHRHNRRERVQLDDVRPQGEVGHTRMSSLIIFNAFNLTVRVS